MNFSLLFKPKARRYRIALEEEYGFEFVKSFYEHHSKVVLTFSSVSLSLCTILLKTNLTCISNWQLFSAAACCCLKLSLWVERLCCGSSMS